MTNQVFVIIKEAIKNNNIFILKAISQCQQLAESFHKWILFRNIYRNSFFGIFLLIQFLKLFIHLFC